MKYQPLRVFGICLVGLLLTGCKSGSLHALNSKVLPGLGQPVRVSSVDMDAAEPAIAASPDGSVYVAWVNHGPKMQSDVMIARFSGDGRIQGSAVRVNNQPGTASAWRGDPPAVAVSPDHTIFVGWTARVESETSHATVLYLSASHDHGETFGPPAKVNDDTKPAVHGMHSLAIGNDGRIYMAWLDERNIAPMPTKDTKMDAGTSGHHMESNRELFFSSSSDGGRTFSANQSVAKDVCPCCKTALAVAVDGRVYLSWRQVLPGDFRHIAVSSSADGGKSFAKSVIVSDDQWMLKGCPVSGATMSAEANGRLQVLWFAGGENGQQGIYWSESQDSGKTFGPRALLAPGFARATPVLVSDRQNIPLAIWEASANGRSEIHGASLVRGKEPLPNLVIAASGELPAAIIQNDRVLISYVAKEAEKRSVWILSVDRSIQEVRLRELDPLSSR